MLLVSVVDKRVEPFHGFGDHVTPFAAVTAVRSTEFKKFLAAKRDAAVSAVAGADIHFCFVEEFHTPAYAVANKKKEDTTRSRRPAPSNQTGS
jgi:hypothetical protein